MRTGSFVIHAGPRALSHLRSHGLGPDQIDCVPAAAGGPKGLALLELDKRLFDPQSGWLRAATRLDLVGVSIGAWRMAAAAQNNPVAALTRLGETYVAQRFPREPTPRQVSDECRRLGRAVLGAEPTLATRSGIALSVLTTRARGVLSRSSSRAAFARVALDNTLSRTRLSAHMQRVVFSAGAARFPAAEFDRFGLDRVPFTADNSDDALLASGSIPLLCEPVRDPAGAPRGDYWDGGLIDYHLLLPYHTLPKLVLYPHFVPYLTPGWLDKFLPWRRVPRAHHWLDNVIVIAPSPAFLARLPNRKLPDRKDFLRYGQDHAARERDWRRAIGESARFADEVISWLERPDPRAVQPL